MALAKYKAKENNPWKIIDNLHNEIDRIFNFPSLHWPQVLKDNFNIPAADIYEDEKNVYAEIDLPGFERKDIELKLEGNNLVVSAKKDQLKEQKKKNYYRCERTQGSIYRKFNLAAAINESKIKAVYKNGVLKVTLPKQEPKAGKDIKIEEE